MSKQQESKNDFAFEIHPDANFESKNKEELDDYKDYTATDSADDDDDDDDDDIGEEIYSVYDDDEAWPRRLKEDEVEMADRFFDAVECGECDIVEQLLEEFPQLVNVTRQKQGGDFALYIAAGMGDLAMAETIMKPNRSTPVQVHARTIHGHTALSAAALFGHPSVVECLITCGLDVNSKNVEGLRLIDEVLDDIDYTLVEDYDSEEDLDLSQSVTRSGGGSDPLLLEKAGILLLRAGATMSNSNVYAFHDKFVGAWGDVTDEELQQAIERACSVATKMELEQERTNEIRARTPALVVRRLGKNGRNGGGGSNGMGSLDEETRPTTLEEEARPSLFKASGSKDRTGQDDQMDANGFATMKRSPRVSPPNKGGRSRAGRIRQRRYIRSPKVATSEGGVPLVSPSKPPSPDKSSVARGASHVNSPSSTSSASASSGVSVRPRGTPPNPRIIQDLSDLIQEEYTANSNNSSLGNVPPEMTHSDDSLDVSWSKQVDGPPELPPRPRSHGDNQGNGFMLEESQPPRVKLPSIAGKK